MRSLLFSTCLAIVALSASAGAQETTDLSVKDTRRVVYDYGKCVVGRNAALASDALLSAVDNYTLKTRYGALIDGNCLVRVTHAGGQMRFTGDLYRYALADGLFSRELGTLPAPDLTAVAALQRRVLPPAPQPPGANGSKAERAKYEADLKSYEEDQGFRALDGYGECVVRADPAGARTLLLTRPTTSAEDAAFSALLPALDRCMSAGTTIALGKLSVRGSIAVNYYRLAHAASLAVRH